MMKDSLDTAFGGGPLSAASAATGSEGAGGVPSPERRALAWFMVQFGLMPAVQRIATYGDRVRRLPSFLVRFCFRSCEGCRRDIGGYLAYYYRADGAYHIECLGSRIAEAKASNGSVRPEKALGQRAPRPRLHSPTDTEPPLPAYQTKSKSL